MKTKLLMKIILAVLVGMGSYLFGVIGLAIGLSVVGFYALNKTEMDEAIARIMKSIGGGGTVPPVGNKSIGGGGTVPPVGNKSIGGGGTVPPKK